VSDPRFTFLRSVTADDERSLRELISGTTIRILLSCDAGKTFAGQVLTYQLATLTARLFDRVEIYGEDADLCHPRMTLLSGPFLPELRLLLGKLRPLSPMAESSRMVNVVVGQDVDVQGQLFLGATAWGVLFSQTEPQSVSDTTNPIGALAAGTLGASEVFKHVFSGKLRGAVNALSYTLSLLDYREVGGSEPALPDCIDVDATLFGSGSIGCGFLLGTIFTPQLHGALTIVDNGRFDMKNPYKYALLDWSMAQQGPYKAAWAQRQIQMYAPDRLTARAFVGTAESYVASLPHDYTIPLALSAVDTHDARLQIQDTLPGHILNAGIDGTLAQVSVHGFGKGPCLACLSMQVVLEAWNAGPIAARTGLSPARVHQLIQRNEAMTQQDLDMIRGRNIVSVEHLSALDSFLGQPLLSFWNRVAYSEAPVQVGESPSVLVTTAFVSAFAGILLLAELIKQSIPELQPYRVNNSYQHQLLGIPAGGVFQYTRDARGWCLCHSTYRLAIYREKYLT
jgi:hypothetical protein